MLRKVQRGEFPRPAQLDPAIDPALEAVCLKAMATRPEDRYASCRALADDVERWAADEPVSVYRAPAPVRLARWARKHRTGVAIGAGLLQTAVVVLAVSTVLLGQSRARIDRERGRPSRPGAGPGDQQLPGQRPARAGRPGAQPRRGGPHRAPVARPGRQVGGRLRVGRPRARRGGGGPLGHRQHLPRAGALPEAAEQLSKAGQSLATGRRPPGGHHLRPEPRHLGQRHERQLRPSERRTGRSSDSEDRLGREHPETVYAADTWAQLNRGNPGRCRSSARTWRSSAAGSGPTTSSPCAASQLVIALSYSQTDADVAEAESLARESCELWVRRYGPEFPETLSALAQRGEILATRGKLEEARSVLAPLPDAIARVLGPDHFQRGTVLRNYGLVLEATGDLDGAEAQYRQSLAIHSKRLCREERHRPARGRCCTPAWPASSCPAAATPPP